MLQREKGEKSLTPIFDCISESILRGGVAPQNNKEILAEICNFLGTDTAFAYAVNNAMGEELYLFTRIGELHGLDLPPEVGKDIVREAMVSGSTVRAFSKTLGQKIAERIVCWNKTALRPEELFIYLLPIVYSDRVVGFVGTASNTRDADSMTHEEEIAATIAFSHVEKAILLDYTKQQKRNFVDSLERAIDNAGVDIYVVDFYTHDILYMNKSMAAPYGTPEDMMGRKCYTALYDGQSSECDFCPKKMLIDEKGNPTKVYSWDYQRPFDGSWFRVFSAAFRWEEDRLAHVITSTNITENKRNEFLVEQMALNDALTSIPNRRSFERDFETVVSRALREKKSGFILFLDLDNFKYINDAFGHEKGDDLLRKVASYLDGFSNERQQVYRYGGDEFIILIEDIGLETVTELVNLLLFRFSESWDLEGLEYFCTASIGVSEFPADGITYDVLLNEADQAMYEAKKMGKSTVAFSSERAGSHSQMMAMEFALRRALLDGCNEFEVLYHPIVEAQTGRWRGVEALARWNSLSYGVVSPDEFIPICEKLGLIFNLEKWIFRNALNEVSQWSEMSEDFFISFNISAMEFLNDDFAEYLDTTATAYGFSKKQIMLEVVESTMKIARNVSEVKVRIDALREQGVRVALDGFGIGQSSLEQIQTLDVDFLKIDRKFILDFMDDEVKIAIVKAIIMLADAAQAKVCAEGVERIEHLNCLKEIGCEYVQGQYFFTPSNAAETHKALLANIK